MSDHNYENQENQDNNENQDNQGNNENQENYEQPGMMGDQHAAVAGPSTIALRHSEVGFEDQEELAAELAAELASANEAHIGSLTAVVMVTLSMAGRHILANTKDFKKVIVDGHSQAYNLYNPFKPEDVSSEISKNCGEGIARASIFRAVELVDALNARALTVLGTEAQIKSNLNTILTSIVGEVEATLPFAEKEQVCEVTLTEDDDEDFTLPILMKDIVRITGWIHSDITGDVLNTPYTMVINLTVDFGNLYDYKEPAQIVKGVRGFLKNVKRNLESTSAVYLSINMLPRELEMVPVNQMQQILLSKTDKHNGFEANGRSDLLACNMPQAWTPQTVAEVENNLLTSRGDILLTKEL